MLLAAYGEKAMMLSGGLGMAALGGLGFVLHRAFDEWRADEAKRIQMERGVIAVGGAVGEGKGGKEEEEDAKMGYGEDLLPSWFPVNMKLRVDAEVAERGAERSGVAAQGAQVQDSVVSSPPPAR